MLGVKFFTEPLNCFFIFNMTGIFYDFQNILISNSDAATIKKFLKKEDNTALLLLKKPVHWGVADSSEDIDRYLYGNP